MDVSKAKENLSRDFQSLLKNAQSLIEATSGEVDQKTKQARQKLEESLHSAEQAYGELEDRLKSHARNADKLVRDNPYQAMGVTLLVGLFLGWLMGRK